MAFSKFISIILEISGSYYFIIILFDMLKSNSKVAQVMNHAVQFDRSENPVIISDEPEESLKPINQVTEEDLKKYLPAEDSFPIVEVKRNSPMIDLGLETISGDPYTVSAKNVSKFMIA